MSIEPAAIGTAMSAALWTQCPHVRLAARSLPLLLPLL